MTVDLLSGLSRDLSWLLGDSDDHDIIIHAGEIPNTKGFKAHTNILRARSLYFRAVLSSKHSLTDSDENQPLKLFVEKSNNNNNYNNNSNNNNNNSSNSKKSNNSNGNDGNNINNINNNDSNVNNNTSNNKPGDASAIGATGSFKEWYQLNISPEIFEVILRFMYSGRIDLDAEADTQKIFDYLHAADILWLYQLLEHLQLYLIHNRSKWLQQNFVRVYSFLHANPTTYKRLNQYSQSILFTQPQLLFDSPQYHTLTQEMIISLLEKGLVQIKESELWVKVLEWGIKQNSEITSNRNRNGNGNGNSLSPEECVSLQRTLSKFFPLIRFRKMSPNDFNEKVRPYKSVFPVEFYERISGFQSADDLKQNISTIFSGSAPENSNLQGGSDYSRAVPSSNEMMAFSPTLPTFPLSQPTSPTLPTFPISQPTSPTLPTFPISQPTSPTLPTFPISQPTSPTLPTFPISQPTSPTLPTFPLPPSISPEASTSSEIHIPSSPTTETSTNITTPFPTNLTLHKKESTKVTICYQPSISIIDSYHAQNASRYRKNSTIISRKHLALISGWIDGRDLSSPDDASYHISKVPYKFKLLCRGSRHGFGEKVFHKRCDNKGPTVTVIKLEGVEGMVIGGYNPLNWQSPWIRKFEECHHSFIFSISADHLKSNSESTGKQDAPDEKPTANSVNQNLIVSTTPVKSKPIFGRAALSKYAINLHRSTGPAFGTTDLVMKDRIVKCKPDCYTLDLLEGVSGVSDNVRKNALRKNKIFKRSYEGHLAGTGSSKTHRSESNGEEGLGNIFQSWFNKSSGDLSSIFNSEFNKSKPDLKDKVSRANTLSSESQFSNNDGNDINTTIVNNLDDDYFDVNDKSYLEFDDTKTESDGTDLLKLYHFKVEEYEVYEVMGRTRS